MRLSVLRALWQEITDLHGDKNLDSGAPVVMSQFHLVLAGAAGRMGEGGGGSGEGGSRRGASKFCPTPSTSFANQYLEQLLSLWVSHFPRFQAKCKQVISSEPCTMSGIER